MSAPGDLLADAVAVLRAYRPASSQQAHLRREYLALLSAAPDAIWRDGPLAHLTASCFVLDPSARHVLLTLHRKGRFWVQLGGHLEPSDATLAAAARREAVEESGADGIRLLPPGGPVPYELHRHALAAAFGRCREHLDVAYVATAARDAEPRVSEESEDVAWWPVDDLPAGAVPDLVGRLAGAVRVVLGAHGAAGSRPEGPPAAPSAPFTSADTPVPSASRTPYPSR